MESLKSSEELFSGLHFESRTVILHEENCFTTIYGSADLDARIRPLRSKLPRIPKEIRQNGAKQYPIFICVKAGRDHPLDSSLVEPSHFGQPPKLY